jgi:hypothetical protein
MNKPIKKATGKVALVIPNQANFKTNSKQVIVRLVCWGVIPMGLANWLIKIGGLTHE